MEKMNVSGVAKDNDVVRISLMELDDMPGVAFRIFSLLSQHKINVDIILQSIGYGDKKNISFTIAQSNRDKAEKVLRDNQEALGFANLSLNDQLSKVSIVGAGMIGNAGVAASMFEALSNAGINIHMISTSEIKISVLIDKKDAENAVQAIHAKFFN